MKPPVFIVGSPRSGTTLLGDILNSHPQIGRWYEPYFVLDHYFRNAPDDRRTAADATEEVKEYILGAFEDYRQECGCQIVVDKSPRNSLKIPFLLTIFPVAKFIHILRDGRDVALSIHREWQVKAEIIGTRNPWRALHTVKNWLDRQPFLAHKMTALLFEIGNPAGILQGRSPLNRSRWLGRRGWGPRFSGWESVIDKVSCLEFNAIQWIKCVEAVLTECQQMDEYHFIEVRYESLIEQPEITLKMVFDFLELDMPADFMSRLPDFKSHNYNKWETAFSDSEKVLIGPILNPLLMRLGYASDDTWYRPRRLK